MANAEHVALVRRGAAALNAWRKEHPDVRLELSDADLRGAQLTGADFRGAVLNGAIATGANLERANFTEAVLVAADLSGAHLGEAILILANLRGAHFKDADLTAAQFSGADLTSADLSGANITGGSFFSSSLRWTNLAGTDLTGVLFGRSALGDCDLSQCIGLEKASHLFFSSIGADTLVRSFQCAGNRLTPGLETFFRGAGVAPGLLAALSNVPAKA